MQSTGANDVVVTLDEQSWFKGVDLAGCLEESKLQFEPDGSLRIDQGSGSEGSDDGCGDIAGVIKENIKNSGNVVDDDDMDDPHPEETSSPDDSGAGHS